VCHAHQSQVALCDVHNSGATISAFDTNYPSSPALAFALRALGSSTWQLCRRRCGRLVLHTDIRAVQSFVYLPHALNERILLFKGGPNSHSSAPGSTARYHASWRHPSIQMSCNRKLDGHSEGRCFQLPCLICALCGNHSSQNYNP
jgi:hypothetical protein